MEHYIGIENELASFKLGTDRVLDFGPYFDGLKKLFPNHYGISNTAIRTETGNGFYVDGSELEILTPPIAVNRGFASRLTDSLMIGRNYAIRSAPDLVHTGYSMHWNFSGGRMNEDRFAEGIGVPFQLFGLTPVSCGSNLRVKSCNVEEEEEGFVGEVKRFELLGDSINNENQINATALLLGSYSLAARHDHFPKIELLDYTFESENAHRNILDEGRNTALGSVAIGERPIGKGDYKDMSAQKVLEAFYYWLHPVVNELGTKKEIANLESFVFNEQKLEFDRPGFYKRMRELDRIDPEGVYLPFECLDEFGNSCSTIMQLASERDVPLEGRLLGQLVSGKRKALSKMTWNEVILKNRGRHYIGETKIEGVRQIYGLCHSLNRKNPRPEFYNDDPGVQSLDDFESEGGLDDLKKSEPAPAILQAIINEDNRFENSGENLRQPDYVAGSSQAEVSDLPSQRSFLGSIGGGLSRFYARLRGRENE